jgi:hypothetical protein
MKGAALNDMSRPGLDALIAKQRAPGPANSHSSGFEVRSLLGHWGEIERCAVLA